MSSDLLWLLTRRNSSFIVDSVPEGPVFSREPGNLLNVNSHKYSGLANTKTIHIAEGPSKNVQIITRKPSASPHAVKSARHVTNIRFGSTSRRAARVAAQKTKFGYRPDLRKAAIARTSAILASQKEKKPLPEKKPRGRKARLAQRA